MKSEFAGIMPAVVTPLTPEGEFSAAGFEKLLERTYSTGVHGIYVCGNTGEGPQLPVHTRKLAAEVAIKNTPPGRVAIIHTGAANTADAVELSRHAARAGAHAISSMPPSPYYSFIEVKAYYEALAAAAGIPLFVYYIPVISRAIETLDQILDLCAIPNVVGLKFTDYDFYKMSALSRAGQIIFNGSDDVLAAGLLMGAHGGIGTFYGLVPELFLDIYNHAQAGRFREARQAQDRVNDLVRAVLKFPALTSVKKLLAWSGIDCGTTVGPRRQLTPQEESRLRVEVREAGFDPEGFLKTTVGARHF